MEETSVNSDPTNLTGMSAAAAKEYIFGFIATLKLTEKEILTVKDEKVKWDNRIELARSKGTGDLLAEAEKEAELVNTRLAGLLEEEQNLKESIVSMRRQIPGLAARERSIDPDLLEQELLAALGRTGEEADTDMAFKNLEKEASAEAALEALKSKMNEDS